MVNRMKRWLDLLAEKVKSKLDKCVVMPGNDDETVIDPIIKSYEDRGITYPLGEVIDLGYNYEMISLDYVNTTPWNTPRECSEKELGKKVGACLKR